MKNRDIFEHYADKQWVIEENLYYLIELYLEKSGLEGSNNYNIVSFIKEFMTKESYVDTDSVDKLTKDVRYSNEVVIEGDYREIPIENETKYEDDFDVDDIKLSPPPSID